MKKKKKKRKMNYNAVVDDLGSLGDSIASVVADSAREVVPAPASTALFTAVLIHDIVITGLFLSLSLVKWEVFWMKQMGFFRR
jgi:hypothetical protein